MGGGAYDGAWEKVSEEGGGLGRDRGGKGLTCPPHLTVRPSNRPTASPERMYDLICRLQGQHLPQRTTRDAPPRHIEVRLHPDTLPAVMECATPNMGAAWESGQPFPSNGPHRVEVVERIQPRWG